MCDVNQLAGPGSAQVTIRAHLDGRFFAVRIALVVVDYPTLHIIFSAMILANCSPVQLYATNILHVENNDSEYYLVIVYL